MTVKNLFCPGCRFDFDPDLLFWGHSDCMFGIMYFRTTYVCPVCEMASYVDLEVDLEDGGTTLTVDPMEEVEE